MKNYLFSNKHIILKEAGLALGLAMLATVIGATLATKLFISGYSAEQSIGYAFFTVGVPVFAVFLFVLWNRRQKNEQSPKNRKDSTNSPSLDFLTLKERRERFPLAVLNLGRVIAAVASGVAAIVGVTGIHQQESHVETPRPVATCLANEDETISVDANKSLLSSDESDST